MPVKTIPVNGPHIEVMPRAEEPMRMTQAFATTTSASREEIEVLTMFGNPLVIILRGEKLSTTIDIFAENKDLSHSFALDEFLREYAEELQAAEKPQNKMN